MSGALARIGGAALSLAGAAGLSLPGGGWKRSWRQASYRGVPFCFDTSGGTYGRRYAMHEYPGRDVPYAEDLGRAQRTWTFNAYVIGSAFHTTRTRLLSACEAPGPGSLVLPYIGRVQAVCTSVDYSDARTQGGYAAVTLSFAESGANAQPSGEIDSRAQIEGAAGRFTDAQRDDFLDNFSVGSGQSYVGDRAGDDVSGMVEAFNTVRMPSADYDQAPLAASLDGIDRQSRTLVYNPPALFGSLDGLFEAFTAGNSAETGVTGMLSIARFNSHTPQLFGDVTEQLRAFKLAPRRGPPLAQPPLNGPHHRDSQARLAEALNAASFQSLVRRLALREIAYLLPGVDLDNVAEAEQMRADVFTLFETEADQAAADRADDVFITLTDLAHCILDDLDNRAAQLPSLTTFQTPRPLNALVLAYQLYGDAGRNLDLVARLGVINPAFMPTSGLVLDT